MLILSSKKAARVVGFALLIPASQGAASVAVNAPSPEERGLLRVELTHDVVFPITIAKTISNSGTHKGDGVEFKVADDVIAWQKIEGKSTTASSDQVPESEYKAYTLIAKGTSIYGIVSRSRNYPNPFHKRNLEVRFQSVQDQGGLYVPIQVSEGAPLLMRDKQTNQLMNVDPDNQKPTNNSQFDIPVNAIAHFGNRLRGEYNSPTASVFVTAITGVIISRLKDNTTRTVAALTLFSQPGIGDLLNGTVTIPEGEIFQAKIPEGTILYGKSAEKTPDTKEVAAASTTQSSGNSQVTPKQLLPLPNILAPTQ